jgi:hypothetical protein
MLSVSHDHPTTSEVQEEGPQSRLQPAPTTNRALGAEGSEHSSAAPPTPEEIQNLSTMYGEPAISSAAAPADSSSKASAGDLGRTPGFRKTETEALGQLDAKGELDEQTQTKLLNKLSSGQSNDRGRKITERPSKSISASHKACRKMTENL